MKKSTRKGRETKSQNDLKGKISDQLEENEIRIIKGGNLNGVEKVPPVKQCDPAHYIASSDQAG